MQITTASKVSGAALTSLANIPSGAGEIPVANIPTLSDSKLSQITTASKVSGAALTSLANIPSGAGNIPAANLANVGFVAGDWILSTVTTARTGWTNVSATYSNKFIRINATPLATGGANTHTTPSHILTTTEIPVHTHTTPSGNLQESAQGYVHYAQQAYGTNQTTSSTGGGGGHTHDAADNVPAYVQVCIFQKD